MLQQRVGEVDGGTCLAVVDASVWKGGERLRWLILPRRGAYDCSRSAEAAYEEGRKHVHDTSSVGVGAVVALTQGGLV
jgi:hypothetical protein